MESITAQATKVKPAPRSRSKPLPDCFSDHHAPRSVAVLFAVWVRHADATDNGVVAINLRRQSYGHDAAAKAIKFLVAHKLMTKVEKGGGRGVASRYFIRWSFTHPALSTRQRAQNHTKNRITVRFTPNSRIKGVLEEVPYSFSYEKTSVSSTKKENNGRALRWSMSRIRGEVQNGYFANDHERQESLIATIGVSLRRALQRGEIRPGPDLGAVVHGLISRLRGIWTLRQNRRSWYAWGGLVVRNTLEDLRVERLSTLASARLFDRIRQEKEEAQGGLNRFLSEVGAKSLREYNQKRGKHGPDEQNGKA